MQGVIIGTIHLVRTQISREIEISDSRLRIRGVRNVSFSKNRVSTKCMIPLFTKFDNFLVHVIEINHIKSIHVGATTEIKKC